MIEVKPISSRKELKKFVKFRLDLYKDHPYDVPPLYSDEIGTLLCGENPALDIYQHQVFLAERDGKVVGRIAALINHISNLKEGIESVRFGFIDFIDDAQVVEALISAVEKWGAERGMTHIAGPLGFTDFDPEAMLTEGFGEMGTLAGIYNYEYYPRHLESLGFGKAAQWVEYKIPIPAEIPEKHMRIAEITRQKYNLRVLQLTSVSQIIKQGYGVQLFKLLNLTYKDLYGFSELNDALIDYYIKKYIPLLRLELVTLIVDENDRLVSFGVALPSLTRAMQKARGRMFPFGFIHLLRALRGKAEVCDLMLVAAHPDYQSMGVAALLFTEMIPQFQKLGTKYAESNPELENNHRVQSLWKDFGPEMHKRRAVFSKKIDA